MEARATGLTEAEVVRFGEALGAALRPGHVVLLHGPMGAGKTTLTRAIAQGMRVDRPDRVRSPTFNICLVHAGPIPLHHVDLFRLAADDDDDASPRSGTSPAFGALGLEALFDDHAPPGLVDDHAPEASVVVVEWAELMQAEVDVLRIYMDRAAPDRRDVLIRAHGPRHAALVGLLNTVRPQLPTSPR